MPRVGEILLIENGFVATTFLQLQVEGTSVYECRRTTIGRLTSTKSCISYKTE